MPANITPIFPITPAFGTGVLGTANTNRDGTGTMATVIIGGTFGTRINRITIIATGATTAGMVRLFIYDGVSSTKMWKEISVSAITPSATVLAFVYVLSLTGEDALILPNGFQLRAATEKAEAFNVIAEGGDY